MQNVFKTYQNKGKGVSQAHVGGSQAHAGGSQPRARSPVVARPPAPLSEWSSPAVPNSLWCAQNFMLGAGMVIIQPSTHKIVVLHDSNDLEDTVGTVTRKKRSDYWFFPKGRKDVGESLETTAIREAYEEVSTLYASPSLELISNSRDMRQRSSLSMWTQTHPTPAQTSRPCKKSQSLFTSLPFLGQPVQRVGACAAGRVGNI